MNRKVFVQLSAKSEGNEENIETFAWERKNGEKRSYCFFSDGTKYLLEFGKYLRVRREGEIRYEFSLDPDRQTKTKIYTAYGILEAVVKAEKGEYSEGEKGFVYRVKYDLNFGDSRQKHEIELCVRDCTGMDAEGKE